MNVMVDKYKGSLTPQQRAKIDLYLHDNSVRETAKIVEISYGKVRHYAEWRANQMPDLIPPPAGPHMLVYDIETSYNIGAYFGKKFKVNINRLLRHWHLITVAYMWVEVNEDGTLTPGEVGLITQRDDPNYTVGSEDDSWIAKRMHRLFDQADILIAHYGDAFDLKKVNSRIFYHGLGPYSWVQTIDTKAEFSRHFGEASNSLGDLVEHFDISEKLDPGGFPLWVRIIEDGDDESWKTMEDYNIQDVVALFKLYLRLRPWIGQNNKKKHPNLGHWKRTTAIVCPNCMSTDVQLRGPVYTQLYKYQQVKCNEETCGRYSKHNPVRRKIDPEDRNYAS